MYYREDSKLFYFRYQTVALPHGTSLQVFCLNKTKYLTTFSQNGTSSDVGAEKAILIISIV